LEEVVAKLENTWGMTVVAIVTDASGEAQKACQLFAHKYPHIVVLDCYVHQVMLFNDLQPSTES